MQGEQGFFQKQYKAVCFIEVKAARVVWRGLGSQCPVPHLPLSGLPSLMQNVSKFLVVSSNISKPSAAFRGSRQGRERGKGQLTGLPWLGRRGEEGWVFPHAVSFRFLLSGRACHSDTCF